ncbi:MAG: hypothetical protein IJC59_01610 [Lachnospiraceae bacterium]|nr:hypothetical protein [Lachnospiraceae bacterium]
MLFQKRIDRAMRFSRSRGKENNTREANIESTAEYDPGTWREELSVADNLEKGDLPALILSALLVFLPVCLFILGGICILGMFPMLF